MACRPEDAFFPEGEVFICLGSNQEVRPIHTNKSNEAKAISIMKNPFRVQIAPQFTRKGGTLGATSSRKHKDFKGQGQEWKEHGID